MVKFWIEEVECETVVYSNLHELDLSKATLAELVRICIQKWEFMSEAVKQEEDLWGVLGCGSIDTCALCHRFYDEGCFNCPIAQVTGNTLCSLTPYDEYRIWGAEPEIIEAEIKFLYKIFEWVENLAKE